MARTFIPQLVVFDLDFTLWDAGGVWCDCTTPPYHFNSQGRLIDSRGRYIRLYDDVLPILEKLNELDIPVALASRTEQPTWADQLTKLLRVDSLVSVSGDLPWIQNRTSQSHQKRFGYFLE